MHFIFFFILAMSHGFLLQTNSPLNSGTQTAGNQQYITKAELYDIQNQLETEVNFLRNNMNRKLDLLTSQLQQMLTSFEQQITGQRCHNDTQAVESLELKYNEVMGNYGNLLIMYSKQEIELQSVKNKTKELEDELVNLNSLKNINQLTDLRLLQQEVQSISTRTNSLAVNEQARNQDFQALYNSFKEHEVNEVRIIQNLNSTIDQKMQWSEISNNATMSSLNNKIEEFKKSVNVSFGGIHQITMNGEKVAMTACVDSVENGDKGAGYIIKYGDIRTQVNVNNLSSFRTSGKFTCEREGLYLVSAWDMSNSSGSEFSIYKNGNLIANAFITANNWHTATSVVAVDLLLNDTVWVQTHNRMYVYDDQRSCLTIIKIQ